ncbi:hypothetical protein [Niallia sp. 01092]|uniref:hypothetical protein n=1 Tax=unclassified Niallia TaxID=2837522 RepID=UPI003FD63298
MFILMICLLSFSIVLFLLSFFAKDPYKTLQDDLDQLSIQQYQELYKVKKKLKLLEEELLIDEVDLHTSPVHSSKIENPNITNIHAIIKNQVWSLASQDVPIHHIATQSSLSVSEVQEIIKEGQKRGMNV